MSSFLDSVGLGQYKAAFAKEEITISSAGDITDEELCKSIGMLALGHRKIFRKAIERIDGVPSLALTHLEGFSQMPTPSLVKSPQSPLLDRNQTSPSPPPSERSDELESKIDSLIASFGVEVGKRQKLELRVNTLESEIAVLKSFLGLSRRDDRPVFVGQQPMYSVYHQQMYPPHFPHMMATPQPVPYAEGYYEMGMMAGGPHAEEMPHPTL